MTPAIVQWLCEGDVGLSSATLAQYMSGEPVLAVRYGRSAATLAPHDPSDLWRCVQLLDRFPEWRPRIWEMSSVSDEWAALVPEWSVLETLLRHEHQTGAGSAPLCAAHLDRLLSRARG